jgi:hypothetical protein
VAVGAERASSPSSGTVLGRDEKWGLRPEKCDKTYSDIRTRHNKTRGGSHEQKQCSLGEASSKGMVSFRVREKSGWVSIAREGD